MKYHLSGVLGNMARKEADVSMLSPDGYARFFILVDILTQLYANTARQINILDVGGGSEYFEQQLRQSGLKFKLTVLDIIERPKRMKNVTYIVGDATAMTFQDNSFDIVVSTDVYEHIIPAGKKAFLTECLRVAKEVCIIAAPFMTLGVDEAEVVVNDFNKKLFGSGQNWLEEHLEFGKPDPTMVKQVLDKQSLSYDEFGTQNLVTWLLNTHTNLIEAKLGLDESTHRQINKFYNDNIFAMGEFSGLTYRHFYLIYKEPSKKGLVDLARYTEAVVNNKKSAEYVSMIFGLLGDRIAELAKSKATLEQSLWKAKENEKALLAEQEQLKLEIAHQKRILDKLKPIIKMAQTKAGRTTLSTIRKMK